MFELHVKYHECVLIYKKLFVRIFHFLAEIHHWIVSQFKKISLRKFLVSIPNGADLSTGTTVVDFSAV